MEPALILNPNQTLELIKKTKDLIKNVNKSGVILAPFYPIYIPLSNSLFIDKTPAEIKKMLESILINGWDISESSLDLLVHIKLINKDLITEKITAAAFLQTPLNLKNIENILEQNTFNMQVRIFRICNLKKENHTVEVWNDIWCKLK